MYSSKFCKILHDTLTEIVTETVVEKIYQTFRRVYCLFFLEKEGIELFICQGFFFF